MKRSLMLTHKRYTLVIKAYRITLLQRVMRGMNIMMSPQFTFFETLKGIYAQSTKVLIYSCINSRMIYIYGINLRGSPRLCKYLKNKIQLHVAKKLKIFVVKQIHHVLIVLQGSDEPNQTLQGVAIVLLYNGLLRVN